jgi:leucyl-tRNA synthetase
MVDERVNYWLPVDQYIGGIEHAVMHLLYARFIYKVMRDEGLVKNDEPFTKLLSQGMVLKDGSKMSKSKGNVVSPNELVEKYGADTARLFMIFASPVEQSLEWSDSGVEGAYRFLKKFYAFAVNNEAILIAPTNKKNNDFTKQQQLWRREIYTILQQANVDMEKLQLNTVVSASMKLLNLLQEIPKNANEKIIGEGFSILLRLLNPITPHLTHYLWNELKFEGNSLDATWPQVDLDALKRDAIDLVVQVNGKVRGKITVPIDAAEKMIRETACAQENISRLIGAGEIKKIVIVPKKLVNIVV